MHSHKQCSLNNGRNNFLLHNQIKQKCCLRKQKQKEWTKVIPITVKLKKNYWKRCDTTIHPTKSWHMRGFNKSWPSECKSKQIKIKNKPAWVKYVCPSSPLLWYIARVVAYYVATAVCGSDTNSHYCSGNYIYIAIVVLHIHTWPCLSKWVTFSLQLIFKGSFHFLDFGFSAKSDCPVFFFCVCVCVCAH